MDFNWIYGRDNFALWINIESLYCTSVTNIMYVNYTAIKIAIIP